MHTVRKIHSLLSSGAVTVTTGSTTTQRVLKQQQQQQAIQQQQQQHVVMDGQNKCYICDTDEGNNQTFEKITNVLTTNSSTKLPNKVGQIVGSNFMVIISMDDVICPRCINLVNNLDRLETEADRVKTNIINLLNKKYDLDFGLNDSSSVSPPNKMQKLTPTNANIRRINMNDSTGSLSGDEGQGTTIVTRKIAIPNDDENKHQVSAVRQINIQTPKMVSQQQTIQTPGQTQTKKTTGSIKIYKCVSCEYKTPDLKQFQVHYEECRVKNAQCRFCKKIFANANVMKQHIQEKHTGGTVQTAGQQQTHNTPTILYNCSHCQFQTTDKPMLEEHLKTHNHKKIVKVKPFKCRLCSMRFETREQATVHAKSHQQAQQAQASGQQQQQQTTQQTYFKCGACAATFPQKDLLVKHFETHRKPQQQPKVQVQQQQQVVVDKTKLLQDSIEEALREPKDDVVQTAAADANKINFFSCNICSLTFLQETYYNSHMETHKQKSSTVVASATAKAPIVSSRIASQTSVADIKIDTPVSSDIESIFEKMHSDDVSDASAGGKVDKNLVITTQENNVGAITFNITIPTSSEEVTNTGGASGSKNLDDKEKLKPIDMPILDPTDDGGATDDSGKKQKDKTAGGKEKEKDQVPSGPPVSMPSLDDEGEATNPGGADSSPSDETTQQSGGDDKQEGDANASEQVEQQQHDEEMQHQQQQEGEEGHEEGQQLTPMELEGIEGVDGGNIKFIINENGQLIQLDDNHIITTDADGNQILVQGAGDSEQIQQLLQSVSAFAEGDGTGQQMVLVQGEGDGEAQLIDASQLINAGDGHHIVIQQGDMTDDVQLEQEHDGETVAVSYSDA